MVKHFGKKTEYQGYKFDSLKEKDFYQRFCEKYDTEASELKILIHPSYLTIDKFEVDDVAMRGARYTPDIVVCDQKGKLIHVYDIKNGFSSYAIDSACKLRFKLFAKRYSVPVECVVPRANDFKVKIFGTAKRATEHIFTDLNYDWREAL